MLTYFKNLKYFLRNCVRPNSCNNSFCFTDDAWCMYTYVHRLHSSHTLTYTYPQFVYISYVHLNGHQINISRVIINGMSALLYIINWIFLPKFCMAKYICNAYSMCCFGVLIPWAFYAQPFFVSTVKFYLQILDFNGLT
jgi:hypothetical protein